MPTTRQPRSGSLQYWPRKRAAKETPIVRSWKRQGKGLLGFPAYKVGMVQAQYVDTRKNSPTAKEMLATPCTVLECPPVKIASVRFYGKDGYALKVLNDVLHPKLDKDLARKLDLPKKSSHSLPDALDASVTDLRIVVSTKPSSTTIGKKKPELLELGLGGSLDEKFAWVKEHFDKEISFADVFSAGKLVDAHAVTTGKGFAGVVKRFGVGLRSHKAEKGQRRAVIGSEGLSRTMYTAPQSGKMGYHLRTEYNKWLVKTGDAKDLSRFHLYGNVKNPYVLVKGSIAGPKKRLVLFTTPMRPDSKKEQPAPDVRGILQ